MFVEALPHKQYCVIVDDNRRTTLRNRRFLRKISEDTRNMNLDNSLSDPNKATDIKEPLTPVVPPPESLHSIHLEQQGPPITNEPPMLSVSPQPSVTNESSHHRR